MKSSLVYMIIALLISSTSGVFAQVTRPPSQFGSAQIIKGVTLFGCAANQNCSITCALPTGPKTFSNLPWAVVGTYPGSDKLWLLLGTGPNDLYYIGDTFCDFSKIDVSYPL